MIAVDELECLADLPHKHDAGTFGQYKVIANDSVEEFAAFNAVNRNDDEEQENGEIQSQVSNDQNQCKKNSFKDEDAAALK